MVKGEYDFAILVTCLLILALQIHNPFQQQRQSACQCDGSQQSAAASGSGWTAQAPGRGQPRSSEPQARSGGSEATAAAPAQRSQPSAQQRPSAAATAAAQPQTQPQPVYRRPREASPQVARPGGLSTDELLRELDSIQVKAREQQETLAAAGRMPPPSPILEQLKETEGGGAFGQGASSAAFSAGAPPTVPASMPMAGTGGPPPSDLSAAMPSGTSPLAALGGGLGGLGGTATVPADAPLLRVRSDFGRFLEARQPRGLGVVLGVGRGDFALRLLGDWGSAQGLYLVDPFIHIWRGYDDPSNLNDRDHQLVFEDLRNRLAPFEGRYVLVRDFSYSFAEVYHKGGQTPGPPSFVYVDANHAEQAVSRDLELWWPLLAPGGILAGSTYTDDADGRIRVRSSVDRFASRYGAKVYLTHDDVPPSWFIFKQ
mmetsp:Transcript_87310/g.151130  ORF Transcript_87310/g.151130 Transcript_87310/m.151130 type:complete len:428 (+) Transcript_87310:125-1408(+)